MSKKIEQKNILAVEGKDEENFFKALLKYLNIKEVQIIGIGGKDKFKTEFPLYIQTDGALSKINKIGFAVTPKSLKRNRLFRVFVPP